MSFEFPHKNPASLLLPLHVLLLFIARGPAAGAVRAARLASPRHALGRVGPGSPCRAAEGAPEAVGEGDVWYWSCPSRGAGCVDVVVHCGASGAVILLLRVECSRNC